MHLELLSLVFQESSIVPISCDLSDKDDQGYLEKRYLDHMQHLVLDIKGEIVVPLIGLFGCKMFALNYRKFYN